MEKKLVNPLPFFHISRATEKAIDYIDGRRKGRISSLKTSFKKLNSAILGGIEWGRIFTIAGMSGAGKSTICEQIKRDFVDLNRSQDFEILSFEFEMLGQDQVARSLSAKVGKTTKELYSAEAPLTDDDFEKVKSYAKEVSSYPIYYVDDVGTVEDIISTIGAFIKQRNIGGEKGLIVTIDHVLLTKGQQGEDEKQIIDSLCHAMVALKKFLASRDIRLLVILLSQLNREVEKPERILNPNLHYPNKNDIFGASSVFYSSDYVLITHKPSILDGIGKHYGPAREGFPYGLPVYNPKNPKQSMIYWHLIKERFGMPKIMTMLDEFDKSRVVEYKN